MILYGDKPAPGEVASDASHRRASEPGDRLRCINERLDELLERLEATVYQPVTQKRQVKRIGLPLLILRD